MGFQPHYLFDIVIAAISFAALVVLAGWSRELRPPARRIAQAVILISLLFVASFALLGTVRVSRLVPAVVVGWVRCIGLFAAVGSVWLAVVFLAVRLVPARTPGRRRVLKAAAGAALAAPAGLAAFAILHRNDLRFHEVDVRIPSLPPDLDGLRIAQLTDIHLSTFVPESLLEAAVGMANDARPHLTLVTGDLVTTKGDPLDNCLRCLRVLRADAGVFGCMGNHEIYAEAERYLETAAERTGIRFLRSDAQLLRFGSAGLNLAGVDYQRRGNPYLPHAESLIAPGALNVLLSHNPDVFPVAAQKGFDLTISGHTHGGQVTFEMVHPALNIARFTTPWVHGLYEKNGRSIWVSRGIGTIGVPARLGAPPEIVCLRLCAT
jgi:predicted MPP superfamily phosphohydrolase